MRQPFAMTGRHLGRQAALSALAILSLALCACGAKTGLYAPDAGRDAFVPELDAGVDASEPPVCVLVPPEDGPVRASLTLPVRLRVVDVFFLLDATASMLDEIDNVRSGLTRRVVPGVRAAIPDAAFGVALVGEFPFTPYGPPEVRPYELRVPITRDAVTVQGALERLPSWGNFDEPEAQVEGLYQLATGDGIEPYIAPSAGCPSGGSGGACFRPDALPVVILITDAPMHNGPPTSPPTNAYDFDAAHSYAQALAALRSLGVFVIGLGARDSESASPMPHLRALARDTGAVDADGRELAFNIGGSGSRVGSGIVDAVTRLAEGVPLDVDALLLDVPGDAIDATLLVTAIRPLRATPASGAREITPERFLGVSPGTEVTFELTVDTSSVPPLPEARLVPATLIFRAFGRSVVGSLDLEILVPGSDPVTCEDLPSLLSSAAP
ncbi:MAG: VWA domain-containing protein [Deltaproteobacteria bacterium]|nr:VWA domain-containing protein [Deltaproteobacteria bacterium]